LFLIQIKDIKNKEIKNKEIKTKETKKLINENAMYVNEISLYFEYM